MSRNATRDRKRAHTARAHVQPNTLRHIAAQIRKMSDAEVYALTYAGDRSVRRIAMQSAQERAETFALTESE